MCRGVPAPSTAAPAFAAPTAALAPAMSVGSMPACGSGYVVAGGAAAQPLQLQLQQLPQLQQQQQQPLLMPTPVIMYTCVRADGGMMMYWQPQQNQQMALVQVPVAVGSPQCARMQQVLSPEQLQQYPYPEASTGTATPASYVTSSSSSDSGSPSDASNSAALDVPGSAVPGTPSDASDSGVPDVPLSGDMEAGGLEREQAVAVLQAHMLHKCLDRDGCREVQVAFDVLDIKVLSELLTKLHGHALTLIKSPYGNYVMQKVIEVMPAAQVSFVATELKGNVLTAAKHRCACRVICRLLEHCNGEAAVAELVDELLVQAEDLCRHPFAHHVIESAVEHGLARHRHRVFQALSCDLWRNASDRRASFVVEAALSHCSREDQGALAQALLGTGNAGLVGLAQSRFGSHVARALLKFPGMEKEARTLWQTKYGRRLLQDMGMVPAGTLAVAAAAA